MMNIAPTTGMLSKEKLLRDIHKRAKTIHISEDVVQRMIDHAKDKSIRR